MTSPNWNLLQPVDVGGAWNAGVEQGRAQRRERETDNALAAFAQNPNDQGSVNALLRYNPRLGIQIMDQQRQQQAAQQKEQAAQNKQLMSSIGQAVLDIKRLPPEQRAAKWDQYVDFFAKSNPGAAQYRGMYSDQIADAILAEAGLTQDYQQSLEPKYMAPQPGAPLVNTRDPAALQQYNSQFGVGGTSAGPAPGAVVGGYRFRGGNPNDRGNWEPAGNGGPTPTASGTFP